MPQSLNFIKIDIKKRIKEKLFGMLVGALIGTTFGDGQNSAALGAQLGIKYFATTNVALVPAFRFIHNDHSGPGQDSTDFNFGLSFFH